MSDITQIFTIFCITIVVVVAMLRDYNITKKVSNRNDDGGIDEISITKTDKKSD